MALNGTLYKRSNDRSEAEVLGGEGGVELAHGAAALHGGPVPRARAQRLVRLQRVAQVARHVVRQQRVQRRPLDALRPCHTCTKLHYQPKTTHS